MKLKQIAILTSGGDCQGMNATIEIVVRIATRRGLKVFGVMEGYKGLYENNFINLTEDKVSGISIFGGTFLKTARFPEFKEEEIVKKSAKNLFDKGIDALIVIGGDGSYKGAKKLIENGVKIIAIPGTVDNDLRYTNKCLGFDTAVNNATSIIENVKQTMNSLNRGVIFEVMGRYCGDIALYSASATACDIIAVPEKPITEKELLDKIVEKTRKLKRPPVVVVAEKMFDVIDIAKKAQELTKKEFKYSVVGYVQRGGSPSVGDRTLAMQFGVRAVELLLNGIFNVALGFSCNKVFEISLFDALQSDYNFNYDLLNLFYLLNC